MSNYSTLTSNFTTEAASVLNLPIIGGRIHRIFTSLTTAVGVPANLLLFYVVVTTPHSMIGKYSYLLGCFAIFDVITTILHSFLVPASNMFEAGFVFFGYGVLDYPTWVGDTVIMLFMIVYFEVFVLLTFHFIYRYISVCDPMLGERYRRFWMPGAIGIDIVFVIAAVFTFLTAIPDEDTREFFTEPLIGAVGIDLMAENKPGVFVYRFRKYTNATPEGWEWYFEGMPASFFCCIEVVVTGLFISFCTVKVLRFMAANSATFSGTKKLQRQLFYALLAQTSVPLILSYGPPIVHLFLSFTGYAFGSLGDFFLVATSMYPVLDPIIIIAFVKPYRVACLRLLGRPFTRTEQPHTLTVGQTSVYNQTFVPVT